MFWSHFFCLEIIWGSSLLVFDGLRGLLHSLTKLQQTTSEGVLALAVIVSFYMQIRQLLMYHDS